MNPFSRIAGGLFCSGLTLISCLASAGKSSAAVAIYQIEAPEAGNYAPVAFTSPIVSDPAFPGITFVAQLNGSTARSGHAADVGDEIYGANSPDHGGVSVVYADEANHFIQSQLRVKNAIGASGAPQLFPHDAGVANLSFVAYIGNRSQDLDAIRRLDTVAAKGNVTVVAGAVAQTSGPFAGDDLFWSARNALAVRGSDASTPFTPAGGTLGRTHADLWSDGDSSFATGRISGYAAALIDRARALHQTVAAHDYTIRSLLITGADPAAIGGTVTPLSLSTSNHFDPDSGAGKADFDTSLSILNAGQAVAATVSNNVVKVTKISPRTEGYAALTLAKKSLTAILFQTAVPISDLSATLTWDIVSALIGSRIDTSNQATPIADLSLDIRSAKKIAGKGFQLSAPLKKLGLVSDAHNDNVEHLSFDGTLPAGTYAFVLRGDASLTTPAAFSYRFDSAVAPAARAAPPTISIPEPSATLPCIVLLVTMMSVRLRRHSTELPT